ncbi:MAG: tRNA lysidine(34) synthetase TilS [Clostridia bacterium]|nr:tRNA lysidine(34) synthetase TilS [Clostridia bacterium]
MYNRGNSPLRLRIIKTIQENSLLDGVQSVLLGFSGGIDSSVLFDVLLSLRQKYGFTLYAAHVNHMIRGEESDSDEAFVREKCAGAGVELFCERIDVPKTAKETSRSVELAARDARYAFFEKCVAERGIDRVATAHNADDNTETVLFNLVRGTSLKGLCGIPYARGNVIRPLRDCTRQMIAEYAKRFSVSYVTDSTNFIDDCSRNILRLNVIPELRRINPSLDEVINNGSRTFSALDNALSNCFPSVGEDVSALPEYMISACLLRECGNIGREQLQKAVRAIKEKKTRAFSLAGGETLNVSGGSFRTEKRGNTLFAPADETVLSKGANKLGCGAEIFVAYAESFNEVYKYTTTTALCFDNINSVISVRPRREGDTLKIRGMTKSVKREFINKKIARELRDSVPVICVDGVPAAVPFIGVDDSFYCKEIKNARVLLGIDLPFNINSSCKGVEG